MSKGKMDLYSTLFFKELKTTFDVLIFTETWLVDSNANQCNFNGYQSPIHLLRPTDKTEYKSKEVEYLFLSKTTYGTNKEQI